jgi:LAS superfamily LD-carboxypeptidase LdcB
MAERSRSRYIPVTHHGATSRAGGRSPSHDWDPRHVTIRRPRSARRVAAVVAVVASIAAPALAPSVSGAGPAQEPPSSRAEAGATRTTEVAPDGVLRATSADVAGSLTDVSAEVQRQVAEVSAARTAAAEADAAVAAADAAVAATEARIAELTTQTDQVVVDSFINPPSEDAIETLAAPTLAESAVRQSILDRQTDANVATLDELEAAEAQLDTEKAAQEDAVAAAEQRAGEADQALEDLIATQSDETRFVLAVQDRLAANLAEASSLESIDPAAAAAVRAREGELAALLGAVVSAREQRAAEAALQQAMAEAAARAAAESASRSTRSSSGSSSGGVSLGPVSGRLADVACPGGGSITVDSSMADGLASMLAAAAADGNEMCGGGYRDPAAQIALRRANCGSSDYAIYEAPASSCSPPTAPPGTSNHEQGTAVDFTCNGGGALSRSSSCFSWLQSHAASYGFYNLPSEPWHWSNDGT